MKKTKIQFHLFLCAVALLLAPNAFASPVQVFECDIFLPRSPLPIDSLDLKFTMRRHATDVEPFENTETSLWNQAKFADNGTFALDIYPLSGGVQTETARNIQTTILDGSGAIRDELEDKAIGSSETVRFEGYVVEEFSVVFVKNDGSILTDHLNYPETIDPNAFDTAACFVVWRVPGDGIPCSGNTGGGGICTTGTYLGNVTSITTEQHEADHGGETFGINAGMNDAWVNAGADKQGMFITVYPDLKILFLAWFTFDTVPPAMGTQATFGSADQRWATAVGSYSGSTAQLNAELTSGGLFNSSEPLPNQDTHYGTINLDFKNCNQAVVDFDFPSVGESGQFTINRALEENAALCEVLNTQ